MKLTVARAADLEATVSQAGAGGTLALVSHAGCEEQGTDTRGCYTVKLLGLSDSGGSRLCSAESPSLCSVSAPRHSTTWHIMDTVYIFL